jgi:hypothetical protein
MIVNFINTPYVLFIGRATASASIHNKKTKGVLIILGQIGVYKIVIADYIYTKRSEKHEWNPQWLK